MNRKRRVRAVIDYLWLMLICLTLTACSSEGKTPGETGVKQEEEKLDYLGFDQNEFQQRMDLSTIAVNVKMISEVRRLPDGEIIEITFTEDGKECSRTQQMPDGTFIQEEWEYNSAGILIRQLVWK